MEAGEVVRQEELVPLVFDCWRQWEISPLAGGRGRVGSLHSELTELALVSSLGRVFSVEPLELGSLSSRSA